MLQLNTLKRLLPLLLALLLTNNAFAQNVRRINVGEPAQFNGWLVTDKVMQEATKQKDELELKDKKILQLEHLRVLDIGDIEHYKVRSNQLAKQLDKENTKRYVIGTGAFILGVLLTGIAAKAAIESTK
jgi:hypothetical protein